MKKTIISFWVFTNLILTGFSQDIPGTYTTSWTGNTYGKGLSANRQSGKWIQDLISGAVVGPNGYVYTTSQWDEGGRNAGVYGGKVVDGVEIGNVWGTLATGSCVNETGRVGRDYAPNGIAVAANSYAVYAVSAGRIFKYSVDGCQGTNFIAHDAHVMYATEDRLLTILNGTVRIYGLPGGNLLNTFTVTKAGPGAIAPNGNIWIIQNMKVGNYHDRKNAFWLRDGIPVIKQFSPTGDFINEITNPIDQSEWWPTHLAFDNQGRLMVSDAGFRRQVLYFNVTNNELVETFGQLGGIGAGEKGVNAPDKFFGQMYAGVDAGGNTYVICEGMSQNIRKFDPDKNFIWELWGAGFTMSADIDHHTDGKFIYSPTRGYELDYSKTTPGTEWSSYSYTLDRIAYPDDPRNSTWINTGMIRTLEGQRVLYTYPMIGARVNYYRFDDELAVHCGSFAPGSWAVVPDANGNFWYVSGNNIHLKPFNGFDQVGCPIYGEGQLIAENPGDINTLERVEYMENQDVLYLTGDVPSGDWGIIGTKMARYDDWNKGNREPTWVKTIPYSQTTEVPGKLRQKAITFTQDYVYTVGVETRCQVWAFDALTGEQIGVMYPGEEVNGLVATGWVDLPYGIRAYTRSNGEEVISVEENGFAKQLLFRWCPTGDCKHSSFYLESPSNNTYYRPGADIPFKISAEHENGIDSITIYANDNLVAKLVNEPYHFSWESVPEGTYRISMLLFASGIAEPVKSATTTIRVENQKPIITLSHTGSSDIYPINSTIELMATAFDPDGTVDSVSIYHEGILLGTILSEPYAVDFDLTDCFINTFTAVAYDNDGDSTVTDGLKISVILPGNGKGTLYREMWTGVTGETVITLARNLNYPTNPTSSAHDSIFRIPRNIGDNYGTRVRGYLVPPSTGDYTFYISSDDGSVLFLSTDSLPENKIIIAQVPGWTNVEQWDKYPQQVSMAISLEENKPYYIEALFKEGGGGDHLTVAWEGPCMSFQTIKGIYLSPYTGEEQAAEFAVNIVKPENNDTLIKGSTYQVAVDISGNSSAVNQVVFYRNNLMLQSLLTPPFTINQVASIVGNFSVQARGIDKNYVTQDSPPINFTVIVDPTTHVINLDNKDNQGLSIYPNPWSNGKLTIERNGTTVAGIRLLDITGAVIYQGQLFNDKTDIPFLDLRDGIYFIEISENHIRTTHKIIVSRK